MVNVDSLGGILRASAAASIGGDKAFENEDEQKPSWGEHPTVQGTWGNEKGSNGGWLLYSQSCG